MILCYTDKNKRKTESLKNRNYIESDYSISDNSYDKHIQCKSFLVLLYTDILKFLKGISPDTPKRFPYAALMIMICMIISYILYFYLAIYGDKSAEYFKLYVLLFALLSFIFNFWSIIAAIYAFFTARAKLLSLSIFIISLIIALIIINAFITAK